MQVLNASMRTPLRTLLALVAAVASFAYVYADVAYWLVDDWDPDGNYSHGFFVVPIALYFAWERRAALRSAPLRPSAWGMVGLLVSMVLLVLGAAAAETFVTRLSLVIAVVSIIWFAVGSAHVRILGFPLAFLLAMIPIPSLIFNQVTFPLQLVASGLGENLLRTASIPVLREGNLIMLPHMTLEVAEACSGLRSLVSLFTLSLLYGYVCEPRTAIRLILAVSTLPIAIAVNGLRIAVTGVVAHNYGLQYAEGFFHSSSGWAMFVVAGAILIGVRAVAHAAYGWPRPAKSRELPAVGLA
jgi:exosortase